MVAMHWPTLRDGSTRSDASTTDRITAPSGPIVNSIVTRPRSFGARLNAVR
jgi:hypothetical protein